MKATKLSELYDQKVGKRELPLTPETVASRLMPHVVGINKAMGVDVLSAPLDRTACQLDPDTARKFNLAPNQVYDFLINLQSKGIIPGQPIDGKDKSMPAPTQQVGLEKSNQQTKTSDRIR